MTEKSEVKKVLEAVAEFNNSINGFKDNIIKTVREDIEKSEKRVLAHIDRETGRTNEELKKVKIDVEGLKEGYITEKSGLARLRDKLDTFAKVGGIVFGIVNAVIIYFVIKGMG